MARRSLEFSASMAFVVERLRDVLAILPGGKIHGMADQVNDAGLNDRLRENRIDGFRKALQAIDDGDQNVLGAAVL